MVYVILQFHSNPSHPLQELIDPSWNYPSVSRWNAILVAVRGFQTGFPDIKGRSWINPAPVYCVHALKTLCFCAQGKEESGAGLPDACIQDEAVRVYLRGPIQVHYVGINNSAEKCAPLAGYTLQRPVDTAATGLPVPAQKPENNERARRQNCFGRKSLALQNTGKGG